MEPFRELLDSNYEIQIKMKYVILPHKGSHFMIPKEIQQLLLVGLRKTKALYLCNSIVTVVQATYPLVVKIVEN